MLSTCGGTAGLEAPFLVWNRQNCLLDCYSFSEQPVVWGGREPQGSGAPASLAQPLTASLDNGLGVGSLSLEQPLFYSLSFILKNKCFTLVGVTHWIECPPANERVTGSIPSQGTCLGCGPGPQ